MPTATKKKPASKPLVFGSPPPRTEAAQAADEYMPEVVKLWAKAGVSAMPGVTHDEYEALHDVVMHVVAEVGDKHAETLAEVRQELEAAESRNDDQEKLIADLREERNEISDELDEARTALEEAESEAESLNNTVEELRAQLDREQEIYEELEQERDDLKTALADVREALNRR